MSKINIDIIYIALNFLLLGTFTIAGQNISQRKNYLKNSIWCVIIFTLVQGLRYARGNDYRHYQEVFLNALLPEQKLFTLFNDTLIKMGFNEYTFFLAYAFVFVVGALVFLRHFKEEAKWVFPLFIVAMLFFEEYMIRQALSYSFVFVLFDRFYIYSKNKSGKISLIIETLIVSLIIISIHSANLIIIGLFIVLYFFYKRPVVYKISVPVYLFCSIFLLDYLNFDIIINAAYFIANLTGRFSGYVENANNWFGEGSFRTDAYQQSFLANFLQITSTVSLLYFGSIIIERKYKENQTIVTIFNLYFIGTTVTKTFQYSELLNRVGSIMYILWFIPLGLVIYNTNFKELNAFEKILFVLLVFFGYSYSKYLFMPETDKTMFLWDAQHI